MACFGPIVVSLPSFVGTCRASESGNLDTILDQLLREDRAKVTPGQEAALLAHCTQHSAEQAPGLRDKIEEESMLAGLGVISPDEIGNQKTPA